VKIQRITWKPRFDVDRQDSRAKSRTNIENSKSWPIHFKSSLLSSAWEIFHGCTLSARISPNSRNYSCTELFSPSVVYPPRIYACTRDSVISMRTCATQI